MPFTSRMLSHVAAMRARRRQGRTKTVVFVQQQPLGTYVYTAVNVVWRTVEDWDLSTLEAHGHAQPRGFEVLMECDLTIALAAVAYVADTPTATQPAVAAADKYEILERALLGVAPGGDRWKARLRKLR